MLEQEPCDLVLATQTPGAARLQHLKGSTAGRLPTVFQAVPVEDSSWWVPVLEDGRPATNLPAFRPAEFAGFRCRLCGNDAGSRGCGQGQPVAALQATVATTGVPRITDCVTGEPSCASFHNCSMVERFASATTRNS